MGGIYVFQLLSSGLVATAQLVEQPTNNPKFKGSNSAAAGSVINSGTNLLSGEK